MEWEPNERDAWVADAQRWITQIKGVLQCKIDLDAHGEIAGVHVVAGLDRDPRHIVRDVESLLKARLQMDVYYKKIGVVQVVESPRGDEQNDVPARPSGRPAPAASGGVTFLPPRVEAVGPTPAPPARAPAGPGVSGPASGPAGPVPAALKSPESAPVPAILVAEDAFPRPVCLGVSLLSSERSIRAEVRLSSGGVETTGVAEGANFADSDLHCIARATVDAVGLLLALPVVLHLREVRLDVIGGRSTVLVAVDLVESRRTETLLGACAARHNRQQSIVHAVLAALNRRLGLFAVREASAED